MYSTDKAIEIALESMQCLGGNGYINGMFLYSPLSPFQRHSKPGTDYPTGRYLRDARLYAVGAGTQEVRRMLIGREFNEEILGKGKA
jgi:isovaleryl-CoA dehydrogenase